jgi:hypothetical protein
MRLVIGRGDSSTLQCVSLAVTMLEPEACGERDGLGPNSDTAVAVFPGEQGALPYGLSRWELCLVVASYRKRPWVQPAPVAIASA